MAIANVCKGVCKIHSEYNICRGCLRSRSEIAKWPKATDTEKEFILHSISQKLFIYGDLNEVSSQS